MHLGLCEPTLWTDHHGDITSLIDVECRDVLIGVDESDKHEAVRW